MRPSAAHRSLLATAARMIHVSSLQNLASVLVSDALDDVAIDLLKARGIEVANMPGLSPEDLLKEIPKHDALIVRSGTQVRTAVVGASCRCCC